MRRMSREHRTAAGLRHIADENSRPMTDAWHLLRETFEKGEQRRMSPIAVARKPHHLPSGTVDGQRLAARKAAARIKSDRAGGQSRRHDLPSEQLLRGRRGILWMGERRQRNGFERAFVLREGSFPLRPLAPARQPTK